MSASARDRGGWVAAVCRCKQVLSARPAQPAPALRRSLGFLDLVGFGLGCTIGAGIFVSLGVAAKLTGVRSLFLSFVVAAFGCLGSGLAYAEMSTRIPTAGSAYSYVYAVFGEFAALQTGGLIVLGNIVSAAAVARSFTTKKKPRDQKEPSSARPIDVGLVEKELAFPWVFDQSVYTRAGADTGLSLSGISFLLILALGMLNLRGVPAAFNGVVQVFNIAIVLFFVFCGAGLAAWHPLGAEASLPVSGVTGGSGAVVGGPGSAAKTSPEADSEMPARPGIVHVIGLNALKGGRGKSTSPEKKGAAIEMKKGGIPASVLRADGGGNRGKKPRRNSSASRNELGNEKKLWATASAQKMNLRNKELTAQDGGFRSSEPFFRNGFRGVLRGASLVFFAFLGFDMVTTLAEESVNPAKTVPRAIVYTIFASCGLYVAVSLVFSAMVLDTHANVDTKAPLAHAFRLRGAPSAVTSLISLGAIGNTLSTVLACIVANPRILYRMAQDGLIPARFGVQLVQNGCGSGTRTESGGGGGFSTTKGEEIGMAKEVEAVLEEQAPVPRFAILFSTCVAAVFGGFLEFELLADFVSLGALVGFTLVAAGAIELRYKLDRVLVTARMVVLQTEEEEVVARSGELVVER
eukprot:g280.t1